MLKGKLQYKDEYYGVVEFDVFAEDNFDSLKLYISAGEAANMSNYVAAKNIFDKHIDPETGLVYNPYQEQNPQDYRRLDISKSNRFTTNITNMDFCLRVSMLLRYMQISGRQSHNQNHVLEGEQVFSPVRTVQIEDKGYIKYDTGLIREIYAQNDFVTIGLKTVSVDEIPEGSFKKLRKEDNYGNILSVTPIKNMGFKFDTQYLGFEFEPPVKKEPINIFGMFETLEEVIANNPHKNTDWLRSRKYEIVTDENLDQIMQEFYDYDGLISMDTETTGLNITFRSRYGEDDQCVGVVLSKRPGTGYYFPLQHKRFENLCGGDHWYFMEKYMKKLLETKRIIGHNISFDWKVAHIYYINTNFVYDTMLAFGVTKRYEYQNFDTSLSGLVKNIFGLDMFDLDDFVFGTDFNESGITFADLPYDLVKNYAPTDGDMTLSLFEYVEKERLLEQYDARAVFDIEVNFAKVVAYSEFYGYHINVDKIPELKNSIEQAMEKHKNKMFELAGREFNPNSAVQLAKIMYEELGIEQIGDKPSTSKEILGALMEREDANGNPRYPFVHELKSYRDNEGIHKNFLKRLHEFMTPDGYIFPSVFQLGTDTGRTSCKQPNYQSYNDIVKKYVTPRPGYLHFDCDFSQIEYRVLASLARQENLMKEFDDPDLDYHSYQASRMFGVPYALVSHDLRKQSKGVNFGLPYGMGDSSLGLRIFGERTKENTAKAAILRRKFFQGQEKIEEFFETTRSRGVSQGYTSTHWGRRRYYHRSVFTTNEIRRQAGNHVIQGTAADIYKIAINRVFNRIVDEGWLGKVLINVFVHDESLFEVHKSVNMYYFFKAWREEFQLSIDGFCKLFAGAGVGHSWFAAKNQDLPTQYIDEIIEKYHDGMEWDEDLDAFVAAIEDGYEEYKIRRVREYITAPENQGEVIKPNINSLLVEVVGNIVSEIKSAENADELVEKYNSLIGRKAIVKEEKTRLRTLSELLAVYCQYYDIDIDSIDIKSPDEITVTAETGGEEAVPELAFEDDDLSISDMIELRGFHLDDHNNILYFIDRDITYNYQKTTISNMLVTLGKVAESGTYQLAVYNPETKEVTLYNAYINGEGYSTFLRLMSSLNSTAMNFTKQGWAL